MKLWAIVGDYLADASMAIDQVIKYKVGNCLGCGPFQCSSFCILGKVISCNNNILVASGSRHVHNINVHFGEYCCWQGYCNW